MRSFVNQDLKKRNESFCCSHVDVWIECRLVRTYAQVENLSCMNELMQDRTRHGCFISFLIHSCNFSLSLSLALILLLFSFSSVRHFFIALFLSLSLSIGNEFCTRDREIRRVSRLDSSYGYASLVLVVVQSCRWSTRVVCAFYH